MFSFLFSYNFKQLHNLWMCHHCFYSYYERLVYNIAAIGKLYFKTKTETEHHPDNAVTMRYLNFEMPVSNAHYLLLYSKHTHIQSYVYAWHLLILKNILVLNCCCSSDVLNKIITCLCVCVCVYIKLYASKLKTTQIGPS